MSRYKFAPAAPEEPIVHGASRPPSNGSEDATVDEWLAFMESQGIERVCCLLEAKLDTYENLLGDYRRRFGAGAVCHAPIPDFHRVKPLQFQETIRPFLVAADRASEPVVVHCSAGSGRTGHVLALWLASDREYDLEAAVEAVRVSGRRPLEATRLDQVREVLAGD